MNTQILWHPEKGCCDRCGRRSDHTRMFTSGGQKTCFCKRCWESFVEENQNPPGEWSRTILSSWKEDTALELEFSEPTSVRLPIWN